MPEQRNRRRAIGIVGVVLAVAVAAFVSIGAATGEGTGSVDPATPVRTITGTGTGTMTGIPDTMTLELGVDSHGKTVGDALSRNTAEAAKLLGVLALAGVASRDIQTSDFSIAPVTDANSRTVTGYEVRNAVTVTIRDLGHVGDIVDRSTAVAPDDVEVAALSFSIDDNSKLVTAARAAAVKVARDQAAQLASAAGVELGDIQTVTETSEPSPRPLPAAGNASGASAPIEPGSQQLSVQVSVVYAIK